MEIECFPDFEKGGARMGIEVAVALSSVLKVLNPTFIMRKRADEKKTYRDIILVSSDFPPTDDNVVYLCSSNYLTEEIEELTQCCLLIKDKGNKDYSRLRCDYVLFSPSVSVLELRGIIQSIFLTKQNQVCIEFRNELIDTNSLYGILTKAYEKMGCPMLICNEQNRTIFHVGTDYSDDPSFSTMIDTGSCSEELLSAARNEGVEPLLSRIDYPVLVGTSRFRKRKRIFSWINVNGFRCGYLIALEKEKSFTSFDVLLMSTICSAISAVISRQATAFSRSLYLEEYLYQVQLKDLLSGEKVNNGDCTLFCHMRFVKGYLISIDADRSKQENQPFFASLYNSFGPHPVMICQMENNCAILVSTATGNSWAENYDNFVSILNKFGHKAGISDEISSQEDLRKGYLQATDALRICSMDFYTERVAFYQEIRLLLLLCDIPRDRIYNYYETSLDNLLEYDRQKGTTYYNTLYVYISSAYNRTLTADRLFLHRNTVSYQLNKIEELLGFPPDDAERGVSLYLSFKINQIRGIPLYRD